MKKILYRILAAASAAMLLAGCEQVDKEQYINEINGHSSAEGAAAPESRVEHEETELRNAPWTDMTFLFNGKLYAMADLSVAGLESDGWSFDPSAYGLEDFIIEPEANVACDVRLNNSQFDNNFYIGLTNKTGSGIGVKDAEIWSVCIDSGSDSGCKDVVLPGDVVFGMTLDEIKAIYGEPTEETRNDEKGYTQYRYIEDRVKGLYFNFYDDAGFRAFVYEDFT